MQTLSFSNTPGFFGSLGKFCSSVTDLADVSNKVAAVLSDVKARGDKAVLEYTRQFDGAQLNAKKMRVTAGELKAAAKTLNAAEKRAIRQAIAEVKSFHRKTLPKNSPSSA